MKHTLFLLAFLGLGFTAVNAQLPLTDADLNGAYTLKSISRQGNLCHDPSIVMDNITNPSSPVFYIYGSHLGHGKTTEDKNYQQWTTWGSYEYNSTATNSLFCNTSGNRINYANAYNSHAVTKVKNYKGEEVAFGPFNAHDWQRSGATIRGNQWAADIIYNKTMKKWCMYMSINSNDWCSSIVCLTSSSPEGPWKYQGPVVFSGFAGKWDHVGFTKTDDWKMTDLAIATGCTSLPDKYAPSDTYGNTWPNCIDPCVFYDADDNLWMSYGSWSGGIFMLRLDKENGLRDYTYKFPNTGSGKAATSDEYFGKKIAGGYYVSGEASYIEKIGKYYYLFMSYGGLETTGGYQMRIFRSEKPDGPYKDPYGTPAVYSSYVLNYGSSAYDARGMLLMGGYKWDLMPYAEIAQGHNSAFTDHKGRSFVVYHTRSTVGHEGHEVRVHQLFLNQDGWIMAAPYEFSGETVTNDEIASKASIPDSEIPGYYQFMRHEYNQNTAAKAYETPVDIELTADGKIQGGAKGTWTRTAGTDFISLTISDVTYKGVLVRQTIDYSNIPALCISACSSSSGSLTIGQKTFTYQQNIWCSKADYKAAIKYTLGKTVAPFADGQTLTTAPKLPTTGYFGAKVTWMSSDESVMTSDGTIKGKGNVTMTMQIEKDGYAYSKSYNLKQNADVPVDPVVTTYYPECGAKDFSNGFWTEFSDYYTVLKGKSARFRFVNHNSGTGMLWHNWLIVAANAQREATDYAEYFVLRNDNYAWDSKGNSYENTMKFPFAMNSNFSMDTFVSDMNGSTVDMTVTYTTEGNLEINSTICTTSGMTYPYSFVYKPASTASSIVLFFTTEHSYISTDGTGVSSPVKAIDNLARTYNLNGQEVDGNYRGIVIRNGKKYLRR